MGACVQTIADGSAYAVTERSGVVKVVEGPATICRASCCSREVHELGIEAAGEAEYLEVKFRDGHTELHAGPKNMVIHPVDHVSINVRSAITIGDQELIAVYRKGENGVVKRQLVRGPALYVPQSTSEWVHEFVWTGPANKDADSTDAPARKKIGALRFTKLKTIPGKMYFDVENVRTKDNALITVKLMLFYKLTDIDTLLDTTSDPMSEFINSVSADVIQWCAPKKFDDFLAATDVLNTLAPYTTLCSQAEKMGYQVTSVVFRGYTAPGTIQKMHDNAIEKRTALALAKESEEEEQKLADYRLQKQSERAAKEQQLALEKLENEIALTQKKAEADREVKRMAQQQELERLRDIRALDSKKDSPWKYLISKDCQLPAVYQCGTMLASDNGARSVR